VTLPSLAPAFASAAAVVFLFCATSFGVMVILGGAATAPWKPRSTCGR
jgi:thiamine transport system permease protein